ncbi:cytochrome P450 [Sinomicrobium pectinilyticum]|uniref:Cytochrome P450 n=1 Tax=Sinomicrobium pectinilyticum TaxID=1084421 RepID=A0A3N0ELR6_SINP1|nr:cytochrome P450 [Sinomicrobium pectinilyticum]RNL88764.1 cytochrome P450 [Sinomicrobium pectinilyticum]
MNTCFLQSEEEDPFLLYRKMRSKNPVYRDEINGVWAIYGYKDCLSVLQNSTATIPQVHSDAEEMCDRYTRIIRENLARRSNPPQHRERKETVMNLVRLMKPVDTKEIMGGLLAGTNKERVNWTEAIAKVLPVTVLLKSLEFGKEDVDFILLHIAVIKKYMTIAMTYDIAEQLNAVSEKLYRSIEKHLLNRGWKIPDKDISISNLIGLCIQGYDAMRGLLNNVLIQYLRHKDVLKIEGRDDFRKLVTETLRYVPVFHHTRRILPKDMNIGENFLKKGDELLLVLASANRDAAVFERAEFFDPDRKNNGDYLAFGSGVHSCPADHFSINLAVDMLDYITSRFKTVGLSADITYAPLSHARIPEQVILRLSE